MDTGLEAMTDRDVESALDEAVRHEGRSSARVLRCLIEFERRRLHERKAHPSLFAYCTAELGYCEQAAYKRIRTARAAAVYPIILTLMEERRIDLSRVVALSAHLTAENHQELLERAARMSMRELEFFIAGLAPGQVRRDSMRALPSPVEPSSSPGDRDAAGWGKAPSEPGLRATAPSFIDCESGILAGGPAYTQAPARLPLGRIDPVTEQVARVAFNADRGTVADIERACLLLHYGRGALALVMARAVQALLREIDPDRRLERKLRRSLNRRGSITRVDGAASGGDGKADPGRDIESAFGGLGTTDPGILDGASSRRVPQTVRDAVWDRDGGRCVFEDARGRRCSAKHGLEFDHVHPWSMGGRSDDPANIRLLCRLHNQAEARRWFGAERVARAVAVRRESRA